MLQEWSEPLASPGPVQVSFAYGGFGGLLFLGTMAAWMGFIDAHPLSVLRWCAAKQFGQVSHERLLSGIPTL